MTLRALARQVLEQTRQEPNLAERHLALVPCFKPLGSGTAEQRAERPAKPCVPCSKELEQETDVWNKLDAGALAERAAIIEANGVPREWAEGFAMLCTMPRPAAYPPQRWHQIVDDGGRFLDAWGRTAEALGWKVLDVFGVNPDAPECRYDSMGLVPLITGWKVAAITADTARLLCHDGAMLTYYRKQALHESVALWELGKPQ